MGKNTRRVSEMSVQTITCELPVWSAVVLQYSSCLVSRQTANLHQLSGKHFSHCLTLEGKRGKQGFIYLQKHL